MHSTTCPREIIYILKGAGQEKDDSWSNSNEWISLNYISIIQVLRNIREPVTFPKIKTIAYLGPPIFCLLSPLSVMITYKLCFEDLSSLTTVFVQPIFYM